MNKAALTTLIISAMMVSGCFEQGEGPDRCYGTYEVMCTGGRAQIDADGTITYVFKNNVGANILVDNSSNWEIESEDCTLAQGSLMLASTIEDEPAPGPVEIANGLKGKVSFHCQESFEAEESVRLKVKMPYKTIASQLESTVTIQIAGTAMERG